MIKSFLLVIAVIAGQAAAILAPVGHYGVDVGHVGVSPYAYGGWNPYSSYPAQPALASQSQNILRSPFNLGQISTYSKAIDTPFSSVRKSDVRVSNPGLAVAPAYSGIATPLVSHYGVAAPIAKVATAGGLLGVAYSAAPSVSHMSYTSGLGYNYAW